MARLLTELRGSARDVSSALGQSPGEPLTTSRSALGHIDYHFTPFML